jgi:hypothetical protein
MTGYVERAGVRMPISRITAAAMADMGYDVDMTAADPFVAPTAVAESEPVSPSFMPGWWPWSTSPTSSVDQLFAEVESHSQLSRRDFLARPDDWFA